MKILQIVCNEKSITFDCFCLYGVFVNIIVDHSLNEERYINIENDEDNQFYYKCLVGNTNNTNDEKWTCPMVWLEKQKEWVHCDNGIICQYTGLHDKNGKEIYEGDIVKIKYRDEDIGKVIYEYNGFSIDVTNMNKNYGRVDFVNNFMEVIGNIYDNPKLLGGEQL